MTTSPEIIGTIEKWLQTPSKSSSATEIEALRRHLQSAAEIAPILQARIIDGLHARTQSVIAALLPKLYGVRLPISHNTRQTVKALQDSLESLTRIGLSLVEAQEFKQVLGTTTSPEVAIWRIFHAIGRHLALSDLTASPFLPGVWFNLHRTYLAARRHGVENTVPFGAPYDLQSLYTRILLLGALPTSALGAQEWGYIHRLLLKLPIPLHLLDSQPEGGTSTLLWVAPENDMPPVHIERKAVSDQTLVLYIQYRGLLQELKRLLHFLASDNPPANLLPEDISPKTAQAALIRVLDFLESPRKRKFPRRRQGYRTTICFGFNDVIQLFKEGSEEGLEVSEWMVVNESPGGYAAMHVAGRPHKVQVGDLIALRRAPETTWSICVVRWALSENPEHLELGLQEVSPRARIGHMASPGLENLDQHVALLLPAVPPFRTLDAIAFDPNKRPAPNKKHLLVLDGKQTQVMEFSLGPSIEQSADVEVFLIEQSLAV